MFDILSKRIYRNVTVGEGMYFLCWFVALAILWKHLFYFDGKHYWAGWTYIWGDWQMHIPIVLNVAYRPFPLLSHPLLSGEPFRYHFAADMISGLLMKIGFSLQNAMVFPSFVSSVFLVISVYFFYREMFKRKNVAILASLIFFFNGGLGALVIFFQHFLLGKPLPPAPPLIEFTKQLEYGIQWLNNWTGSFIPQRPFLLGAPIGIVAITICWKIYIRGIRSVPKSVLCLLGIGIGLMPIIHIHTYVIVNIVAFYVFVLSWKKIKKEELFLWTYFAVPVSVISALLFYYVFRGFPHESIYSLPAMGQGSIVHFFFFWVLNAGMFGLLLPIGVLKSDKHQQLFYLPFLFIFFAANAFPYQKSWLDNKLLTYWDLASSGFVAMVLVRVFETNIRMRYIVLVCVYALVISGFGDFMNVFQYKKQQYQLFSVKELSMGSAMRDISQPDDIFLTAAANTWPAMTMGRPIVMTWKDWIVSHGTSIGSREQDIAQMYQGVPDDVALLRYYHVSFVIIGPVERSMYAINEPYFKQIGKLVFTDDDYSVYDVRALLR